MYTYLKFSLIFLMFFTMSFSSVSVKSMSGHQTADVISLRPYIELINESDEDLNLSEIAIDYYIYEENLSSEDLSWEIYWNDPSVQYQINFYDLEKAIEKNGLKANIKCQITFIQEKYLNPGTSVKLQHGIYKTGWNYTFNQRDDWSYLPNTSYLYNENIVVINQTTGEILYGNSIEGNVVPRPYSISVNWIGEHTFSELTDVNIKEGDAFLNKIDKAAYIFYQEKWTLLSDVQQDLSQYATKEYVDNAVIIPSNSITADQISKDHLANVNADLLDGLHANEIIEAAGNGSGSCPEIMEELGSIKRMLSLLLNLQYKDTLTNNTGGFDKNDYLIVRKILDENYLFDLSVSSVVSSWFTSTGKISGLNFSGKGITQISSDIANLSDLETLDFYNSNLSSIPSVILNIPTLKILNLSSNNLSNITTDFSGLPNLTTLNLSKNQLSSFTVLPGTLQNLAALSLNENQITTLTGIGNLNNLQSININDNNIVAIPEDIGNLSNLGTIAASRNNINFIPGTIGSLSSLRHLFLSNNYLTNLPDEIMNLNLQAGFSPITGPGLLVGYNRLCNIQSPLKEWLDQFNYTYMTNEYVWDETQDCETQFDPYDYTIVRKILDENSLFDLSVSSVVSSWFTSTGKISGLNFSGKGITQISSDIANLSDLETLNFYNSNLSSIPSEILNIPTLKTLNLSSNNLSNITVDFSGLPNLTTLNLSKNQLSSFTVLPGTMQNLAGLSLNGNQLTALTGIGNLNNLQTLDISDNKIVALPEDIGNLSNLGTIAASRNNINFIPGTIGSLSSLRHLYLSNNYLTNLPDEIMNLNLQAGFSPITGPGLLVGYNRLCNIQSPLKEWLDQFNYTYMTNEYVWDETQDCN